MQIAAVLLGIWLPIAPDALGYGDAARTVERAIGPVVIAGAALAVRSVTRPCAVRQCGDRLALLRVPWVFAYTSVPAVATSGLAGMAVLGLALVGGRASNQRARDRQALTMKATETSLAQGS